MPVQPLPTTIGVELEVNNVANAENDRAKIRSRFTRDARGLERWVVKGDASCGNGSSGGVELNSPIMRTADDLRTVIKVCTTMRRLGFKVNGKCGLHVHVDVRRLTDDQRVRFIRFFATWENAFFLLDPDRKHSTYCKPLSNDIRRNLHALTDWSVWNDRYFWMNGRAFREHGTCEFRLMEGTLDDFHVLGWVSCLLYIYDRVVNHGLDGSLDKIEVSDEPFDLLTRLVEAIKFDDSPRAKLAKSWLMIRFSKVQEVRGLVELRARRRENLKKAWRGEAKFIPVFTPTHTAVAEIAEVADSL